MKKIHRKIINYLFGFKGTCIYCPKCHGINVDFGKTVKEGNKETYPVFCKDCKSTGTIIEIWE